MITYTLHSNQCRLQVYASYKNNKIGVLFLHGGPGSGANAIMKLSAFQTLEKEYTCVYFDQRGSGKSYYDLQQGLSIEDITNDVLLVARDMKQRWRLDKIILWGGSFGGLLASLCLEQFIDEFDGVILSSPAITFSRQQAIDFFHRMQNMYIEKININNNSTKTITPEQLFLDKDFREFIFSSSNPSQSLKHICAMSTWFYLHTFENLFNCITIPTLVLQGKEDPICIYQNITNEIQHITNSNIQYYLFDNCGHEVFKDKEKECIEKIKVFIKEKIVC